VYATVNKHVNKHFCMKCEKTDRQIARYIDVEREREEKRER